MMFFYTEAISTKKAFLILLKMSQTPIRLLMCILIVLSIKTTVAQSVVDSPYHINGSAFKENCNCYTLTPNQLTKSGSVWNINKINLNESFEFSFEVNLGCTDANGADGIVFVLQPISTNIGTTGEGLGFEGIRPSIGIALDTWQNQNLNDPAYDHISIQRDGDNNHNSANNLAGPVPISAFNDNFEDCQWHILKIRWNANIGVLTTYIDNVERVSDTINLVKDVFNNDPMVFWGFTGATGGAMNHQRFCTSLSSSFRELPLSESCAPHTLELVDESRSFGTITQWHWDFGDGTTSDQQNPPPHYYAEPGNYTVSSVVLGNNGCWSDTTKKIITVGSIPIPDFQVPDTLCGSSSFQPIDRSFVEFGSIMEWNWTINGIPYSGQIPPVQNINGSSTAAVSLWVRTKEGCISETVTKIIHLLPQPSISIPATSENCVGDTLMITALGTSGDNPVTSWSWGDQDTWTNLGVFNLTAAQAGNYRVTVRGKGANGCISEPAEHLATFYQTGAYAGNDTLVAIGQPLQLNASGGLLYNWTPSSGLSDSQVADPIAILESDATYIVTASTPAGCATTDTINIKVYKGPEIYVPTAFSPNGDGRNDQFRFLAVGMRRVNYFMIYNRLGQKIFEGLGSRGWDGKIRGVEQPAGTYIYVVSGEDYNGKQYSKKGSFVLIR